MLVCLMGRGQRGPWPREKLDRQKIFLLPGELFRQQLSDLVCTILPQEKIHLGPPLEEPGEIRVFFALHLGKQMDFLKG